MPINPPAPDMDITSKSDENVPLSEPPSPYLSHEIYLECYREHMEQVFFKLLHF